LKIFASADNLFVITKYKGMDPEIPAQGGSILAQGLDFTSQRYPLSRITSLGINVTF
jgi:iron complex outermembrane receptor protein